VGVPHLLACTFAVSAAMAGLAGWLYAHHLTYMGPDSMTTHVSISVLLMAVIGGAQTFLGPIVGAASLLLVTLYLPGAETHGMVYGATLIFVLLVAPNGLTGTPWKKVLQKRLGAWTTRAGTNSHVRRSAMPIAQKPLGGEQR
jgi:branched-chain amino acid transport system permease protein